MSRRRRAVELTALAGAWRLSGPQRASDDCARMLAAQAAYGPHHVADWRSAEVAIGRRLFRSLPEDRFDRATVTLNDGGVLVADARLDNRAELAAALGIGVSRVETLSDASLLAAAWSRWREACFERLLGDYAFAIWDMPRRQLLLARDPFGRRPLHFHHSSRLIAFASVPVGLHALPDIPVAADLDHMAAFLALRPERTGRTFFQGVCSVEPGSLLTLRAEGSNLHRHYRSNSPPPNRATVVENAAALREHLDRAVKAQLRGAETTVGVHLSSGWDSAAVTATAVRHMAGVGGTVTAFTAAPWNGGGGGAPAGRHGDEVQGAADVRALYPEMEHIVVTSDGRSPLEDLDVDMAFNGRPSLNACNHLWFNDINRIAKARGLRIMLTGDFGNLGLTDDGLDGLAELVSTGRWVDWWRLGAAGVAAGRLRWLGVLAASFEHRLPQHVGGLLRQWRGRTPRDPNRHSALEAEQWARMSSEFEPPPMSRAARRWQAITHLDTSLYVKGALGHYGIVVRDPLGDRRLIEFCQTIPIGQLAAGGRLRGLAHLALADRLPAALFERRTRGYQAADWHAGLTADRERLRADVERLAAFPPAAGILDIDRLRTLVSHWPAGGWHRDEVIDDYRFALLRAVAAGRFLINTERANG